MTRNSLVGDEYTVKTRPFTKSALKSFSDNQGSVPDSACSSTAACTDLFVCPVFSV